MRRSRAMSRVCGAAALCLIAILALAPGAGAAEPIKEKPRILALEGFYYPVDESLTRWAVGAVMVSRYPNVLPRDLPDRIREVLRFRARAELKLKKGGERIASIQDSGGLPVAAEGRSLYYAHLLLFSHKQSVRILDALGVTHALKAGKSSLQATARSIERIRSKGETVARTSTERSTRTSFRPTRRPPKVVNGCEILPGTKCPGADLAGVRLDHADLSGADLSGADLSRAHLGGTKLQGANLSDANLSDAYLDSANLQGANLSGANLEGAYFCYTTMPDGSINDSGCPGPEAAE